MNLRNICGNLKKNEIVPHLLGFKPKTTTKKSIEKYMTIKQQVNRILSKYIQQTKRFEKESCEVQEARKEFREILRKIHSSTRKEANHRMDTDKRREEIKIYSIGELFLILREIGTN